MRNDLAFCPSCGLALTHTGGGAFQCICGFTYALTSDQIADINDTLSMEHHNAATAYVYTAYHHNQRRWKQRVECASGIAYDPIELIAFDHWAVEYAERQEEMADAA